MKKERLDFLHEEYTKAVQFCNELYTKEEGKLFTDLTTAEENFWSDVIMLATFAIFADGKITKSEAEKFSTFMAGYGNPFSFEEREFYDNLLETVAKGDYTLFSELGSKMVTENDFEEPKSFIVFVLRAYIDILEAADDRKEKRITYNLEYLDYILCHYADLMVSMADEITPRVKKTILKCLNICCDDISKTLSQPFCLSENVLDFIENPNTADN